MTMPKQCLAYEDYSLALRREVNLDTQSSHRSIEEIRESRRSFQYLQIDRGRES